MAEWQHIDPARPGELERWAAQLAVPVSALEEAVRHIGTDLDKIKDYLSAPGGTRPHEAGTGSHGHGHG